jgi:hypothetical protein
LELPEAKERKNMDWNAQRRRTAAIGFLAALGFAVGYGGMAAAQAPETIRYETHSDVVVRYLRATAAATRFIHDPRNRDDVVKAAMELTAKPENRAREMLSSIWDDKNQVLPRQGEVDMDALKAMIALHGRYRIWKEPLPAPERFVDLRYAKLAGIQ